MIIFLLIFILLFFLEIIYFRVADYFNIIDKPNQRSSHTSITLRGGGIIFLMGVWLYSCFYGINYPWFLLGLTAIGGISFVDDIHSVPNKIRLLIQFVSMFLMFYDFGILNVESWWIIIIALIVCVGIINAYNFMDGVNGITGGYSLIVLLPLLYVNQSVQYIDNDFLIVTILSVLVFNIYNFREKAKCFAGDVGSVGIAFIVLFLLGHLILKTEDFTYIILLAVYGVDTVLTIIHRIMLHEKIGEAHRKHVYQIMANELRIPHVIVSCIYMGIQLLVSLGLLFLPMNHWFYSGGVILLLVCAYVAFIKKYYYLHEETLKRIKHDNR